jgi:hypothetical protein
MDEPSVFYSEANRRPQSHLKHDLEILRMVSKSLLEENLRLKGEADSVGKHFTLENATAQSVLV